MCGEVTMSNNEIADKLRERARELWNRRENLYRVKAYRRAAEMLSRLDRPVEDLFHEKGEPALKEIPGIGRRLAKTIARYLESGEWPNQN
jgi:holliday junction DNA helicase RuvA